MATIVISEFMADDSVDALAGLHTVVYDPDLVDDRPRLLQLVADADGLIVRNRTQVDAPLLDAAPQLQVVGRLGVGLDNIDLDACSARSVAVRPATGANADSVAEYVIAAALSLVRGVFLSTDAVVAGEWPRVELTGLEIQGRTMGLIGFGDIAQRVAARARALGMSVIAHDPFLPESDAAWSSARSETFEGVLTAADVVSLHVPLTDDTRGLLDRAALDTMPDTAVVVNTSRGGVVDEEALIESLRSGTIRGAALDVFTTEPVDAASGERFAGVPNLLLTPHIAGITEESHERVSSMVASAVADVLAEEIR